MRDCSGSLCFDQLKEDASSFEGFLYPNESKQNLLFLYLYIYTLFVYATVRVCTSTSCSLTCFPQYVFGITTGASILVAGPQHQQSSLTWSSTSNNNCSVDMGLLVAFALSRASPPQRGSSPFTWLRMSGFLVNSLHHWGFPPWPGRWAPGTVGKVDISSLKPQFWPSRGWIFNAFCFSCIAFSCITKSAAFNLYLDFLTRYEMSWWQNLQLLHIFKWWR